MFVCVFCTRFNKNPKKGVKYLQENGLLGGTPEEVAEFLHTDERLDKVCGNNFLLWWVTVDFFEIFFIFFMLYYYWWKKEAKKLSLTKIYWFFFSDTSRRTHWRQWSVCSICLFIHTVFYFCYDSVGSLVSSFAILTGSSVSFMKFTIFLIVPFLLVYYNLCIDIFLFSL